MQTIRAAAELLRRIDSIDHLADVARALGCRDEPAPLDEHTAAALGLSAGIGTARVAAGAGSLRALLVSLDGTMPIRDWLPRAAARLAARVPHVLWVVLALEPDRGDFAVAAWNNDRRPPRVAALVANRATIVDSDAETVRALVAAQGSYDLITHSRWVDVLGRERLTVRFYRALERSVDAIAASAGDASAEVRRDIALLDVSRLLFLSFLEAKGWLDADRAFLANRFERCVAEGGRFHDRVLRPLFFGTLNTPRRKRAIRALAFGNVPFLNGGLFSRTLLERRNRGLTFSDEAYGGLLFDLFGHFRFTAREESTSLSEAAVDPEMLGRAFESLMVSRERQRTGAFYTPFSLVERVTNAGLDELGLQEPTALEQITVLDPACGSGAFLVFALERLAELRAAAGDAREIGAIRRDVLTRSIFGVDVNPTAVWLCELRLWLSIVIESDVSDPMAVPPLPNLDRNIRVGDALAGVAFEHAPLGNAGRASRQLRERYARSSGARKQSLARALDRLERARMLAAIDDELARVAGRRRDLVAACRGRDLFGDRYRPSHEEHAAAIDLRTKAASLRTTRRRISSSGALPFSFPVHFADVAARGGFSLVVGNPPWVRLHRIPVEQRNAFRREYTVARAASWTDGADAASAGRGFAAQIDVASLFVERSVRLLAPGGALALLVPAKLWRALAGGGVRRLLATEAELRRLEDFSNAANVFDAAAYPSLVVASRPGSPDGDADDGCLPSGAPTLQISVHRRAAPPFVWCASRSSIAFDDSVGSPWLLLPRSARAAFNRLMACGQPLARSPLGRPYLGVKCGLNEAFLVELRASDGEIAEVIAADGRRGTIEAALLRPVVRGEGARRWSVPVNDERIVWTHEESGTALSILPPHAARWLSHWRHALRHRADARHGPRWWSLFRTESARTDRPRVVWADVGREPRAFILDRGDARVALNTCYVARCRDLTDAYAFATLLNSPIARAWLDALAEPARGGYRRYLGWTLALLPIPRDWDWARRELAELGRAAERGTPPGESALFDAACRAYEVDQGELAPLVAWSTP